MSEAARVLGVEDYATGAQPYTVERVAEAFLAELRLRREPKRPDGQAAEKDPQVLKARAEAAESRLQAERALKDARAQAESLLAEAAERSEKESAKVRAKALKEGREEGSAAGHAAGEAKGREEGKAAYAASLDRLKSLLEAVQAEKKAYFADREALLVELALRVAAKVIHREVETRPDHIQNLLRQVTQSLGDKSKMQVYTHPDDLDRLTQAQNDGLLNMRGVKQMEFLADDKIMAGGLRVASGYQTLDAALDSQLAEICRGLLEEAYHDRD